MHPTRPSWDEKAVSTLSVNLMIRLGLLLALFVWCFQIVAPFIIPVVWAIVIAVAVYPLYGYLLSWFGGSNKITATIYIVIALTLLIIPTLMISGSLFQTASGLTDQLTADQLVIPSPNDEIKQIPVVGPKIYDIWHQASLDPQGTLKYYQPQIRNIAEAIVSAAAATGSTIIQFVIAIIISGILMAYADNARNFTERFFQRVAGREKGAQFAILSKATIQSVAQGVLGIAIIQALASAAGMYVMDVPGWGLWTFLILILAVAQLPPILVLLPVVLYVFSVADTTPAIIFAVWSGLVSVSDSILKPMLLGRGVETPMLVILVGSIGGLIHSGFLGLFIGAVILALGYELLISWLNGEKEENAL